MTFRVACVRSADDGGGRRQCRVPSPSIHLGVVLPGGMVALTVVRPLPDSPLGAAVDCGDSIPGDAGSETLPQRRVPLLSQWLFKRENPR